MSELESDPNIEVLDEAISDVGYWRCWAESLPGIFQVEFGGTQLYFPPASPDVPPNGVIALRFMEPSVVAFLTELDAAHEKAGWRMALHRRECDPFLVESDLFTFTSDTSEGIVQAVADQCSVEYLIGNRLEAGGEECGALLAFRAHGVGLIVRAKSMIVIGATAGMLSSGQIAAAAKAWKAYWREYWDRKDSASPMPRDYACEVVIPQDQYRFHDPSKRLTNE